MENQHRLIKGYKELDQSQIDLMNKIKSQGAQLMALVNEVNSYNRIRYQSVSIGQNFVNTNWADEGQKDLQKGLMFLTRAVAKPDFF